jgi:outer membrane protein assembly factor BamB
MTMRFLPGAAVLLFMTATISADNWPQWRGPQLNGLSGETNLPVNWSKTENITWKLPVPERSGATPIVWGDRLVASPLVHGETIVAPSRERPLLVLKAGGRGDVTQSHVVWQFNNGPDVPSPVSDGTHLYSINDRGIMYCLDLKTGSTVYGPQRLRPSTTAGRRCSPTARSTSPTRTG